MIGVVPEGEELMPHRSSLAAAAQQPNNKRSEHVPGERWRSDVAGGVDLQLGRQAMEDGRRRMREDDEGRSHGGAERMTEDRSLVLGRKDHSCCFPFYICHAEIALIVSLLYFSHGLSKRLSYFWSF
jgi:hypothetical protein